MAYDPPDDPDQELARVDLFAGLGAAELRALVNAIEWVSYNAGDLVFRAGDIADSVFFVTRGRFESFLGDRSVGEIATRGTFGETAILEDAVRSTNVRATRDGLVARLPSGRVAEVMRVSPAIALRLARTSASRMGLGLSRESATPRSVAVIAASAAPGVRRFGEELAAALRRSTSVAYVPVDVLRRWCEDGGLSGVTDRLVEAEDANPLLLVDIGDGADSGDEVALLSLALRHVDLVVVVVSTVDRLDGRVLDIISAAQRPVVVVPLRHTLTPRGTRSLLADIGRSATVRAHLHVRVGVAADVDRCARYVTGDSVGVVLGGGGSRGFAHIGVLRALTDAGVTIDRVGGTSMGAVIGAQVAMGWTPDEMLDRNAAAWRRGRLLEPGIPTVSILRGRRSRLMFDDLFGDVEIEDLGMDFFCTTVDLSACRLHVARSGGVAEWTRASASVPGLWPPLVDAAGHLHVDGGLLDNVPTDVMRSSGAGPVIGVDVCSRQSDLRVAPSVPIPTGMAWLAARRRATVRYPSIVDILGRANLLAHLQHQADAARFADLYIAPPVEDLGFAAFHRMRQLVDVGHETAVSALSAACSDPSLHELLVAPGDPDRDISA